MFWNSVFQRHHVFILCVFSILCFTSTSIFLFLSCIPVPTEYSNHFGYFILFILIIMYPSFFISSSFKLLLFRKFTQRHATALAVLWSFTVAGSWDAADSIFFSRTWLCKFFIKKSMQKHYRALGRWTRWHECKTETSRFNLDVNSLLLEYFLSYFSALSKIKSLFIFSYWMLPECFSTWRSRWVSNCTLYKVYFTWLCLSLG